MRATEGCTLLDVDPGVSTNRTVFTFVGSPAAAVEGAINMAKVAKERIDMRNHTGEHPRFGAMDVCPFVPIRDTTMEDCVQCAHEFGRRAEKELDIPFTCTNMPRKVQMRTADDISYRILTGRVRSVRKYTLQSSLKNQLEHQRSNIGTKDWQREISTQISGDRITVLRNSFRLGVLRIWCSKVFGGLQHQSSRHETASDSYCVESS